MSTIQGVNRPEESFGKLMQEDLIAGRRHVDIFTVGNEIKVGMANELHPCQLTRESEKNKITA